MLKRDLSRYTHLVIPSYTGSLLGGCQKKISSWIKNGGNLIAYRDAIKWANKNKLIEEEFRKGELKAKDIPFVDMGKFKGAQAIGAIFNADIDRSHPINFGIEDTQLALFSEIHAFSWNLMTTAITILSSIRIIRC